MIDAVLTRVQTRLGNEPYDEGVLADIVQTVTDRLSLRLGLSEPDTLPALLYSVGVDASIKAFRRRYYEGIKSETEGGLSTSFVEDILDEYASEIKGYIASAKPEDLGGTGVVRFL